MNLHMVVESRLKSNKFPIHKPVYETALLYSGIFQNKYNGRLTRQMVVSEQNNDHNKHSSFYDNYFAFRMITKLVVIIETVLFGQMGHSPSTSTSFWQG